MTSKTKTQDTAAAIWAQLDATPHPTSGSIVMPAVELPADFIPPSAALAPAPAGAQGQAPELPPAAADQAKHRRPRTAAELAREALALAGITSGRARRELHRPKYGEQTSTEVPLTGQGRLDATELAVAGRSRRYHQDLEGWARAAVADVNHRGVLVVWDGMAYHITLDPAVPPRTITEVHRRDLAAWRADIA